MLDNLLLCNHPAKLTCTDTGVCLFKGKRTEGLSIIWCDSCDSLEVLEGLEVEIEILIAIIIDTKK